LNQASDEELWKIIALCSDYWLHQYQNWNERDNNNLQKVYAFARKIREIFDIQDCSYESNFEMLNVALNYIKQIK